MTMTWSFGLRTDAMPDTDDHRRLLGALWERSRLSEPVRDVVQVGAARAVYEIVDGVYRRCPDEALVVEAIERAGGYIGWPNLLCGDFHFDVEPIGVPFPVDAPDIDLPVRGATRIQYIREQSLWLMIDDESELLADHGLSVQDVVAMNERVHRIEDVAMAHGLLMSYG